MWPAARAWDVLHSSVRHKLPAEQVQCALSSSKLRAQQPAPGPAVLSLLQHSRKEIFRIHRPQSNLKLAVLLKDITRPGHFSMCALTWSRNTETMLITFAVHALRGTGGIVRRRARSSHQLEKCHFAGPFASFISASFLFLRRGQLGLRMGGFLVGG